MGYYNQALTDYVGKICDVERELYTTQRLIANLDLPDAAAWTPKGSRSSRTDRRRKSVR